MAPAAQRLRHIDVYLMFPMLDPSTARLRGGRFDCLHDLPASRARKHRTEYEFPCTLCGGVVIVDVDPAFVRTEDVWLAQWPEAFATAPAERLSECGL